MKSLNQIIAELESFATAHWQIHTFGHGDVWEISPQSDGIVYPILWMVPQTATPAINEVVDEFTVLCMDLVDSGELNETDVLSDTRQIMLDVCAYYQQTHTNDYIIEFGGSIQPFTERDPERVSGHSLTVRIKQPHDYNLCAVPASAVPVPATPSCADATVTVNTAPFGTVPSGGTLDVPVVNSAGTSIGSKVGANWQIDPIRLYLNGSPEDLFPVEAELFLNVTRDGVAYAPTYDSGTKTLEVVSAGDPPLIRDDYSQFLIYLGYGPESATDSTPITIKRVTIDPVDGSVTEDYSTNPWTNFADGPWSPTPP